MDFFDQSEKQSPTTRKPAGEKSRSSAPLAERMRPREFGDVVGQEDILGSDSFLLRLMENRSLPSLVFWGPPGCGKTTLASLIAAKSGLAFETLSAVTTGIKEVKEIIEAARARLDATGKRTILFVDEIHRFNKAQQDAFLPHVESGVIVLFGATTENPSFSIIAPLLSRSRVVVLKAHTPDGLLRIMRRALSDAETGLGKMNAVAEDDTLALISRMCDGDARRALNLLDQSVGAAKPDAEGRRVLDRALVEKVSQRSHLVYDKSGEEHFNLISALHKSLRASDAQAALYWLARMLASGEEPLYVARRLVRFAVEDVGLADPQAVIQAQAGMQFYHSLGSPEGELGLAQATLYLATCPKSNSVYAAYNAAHEEIKSTGALPAPLHIRNAPTPLMKEVGYGKNYSYDHDAPDHFSGQECLPDDLLGKSYYVPGEFGYEREIAKRLDWWKKKREERKQAGSGAK